MNRFQAKRILSIAGFSLLSAFLLSFLFEGQVLYGLLHYHELPGSQYILGTIVAHFLGLFSSGFLVKSLAAAKRAMLVAMTLCLVAAGPFFFTPSPLWMAGLIVCGYASGWAIASWGHFLKTFTPKNQRLKICADVLIFSNLLMIVVNVVAANVSPLAGFVFAMLCLVLGMVFIGLLPVAVGEETGPLGGEDGPPGDIKKPLLLLCLFVFVITINSGLMYQVINPAFAHLTGLVSWYWAVPYIGALALIRNLSLQTSRSQFLYVAMAMIVASFVSFMLLGRGTSDYLVVDTLMLGACGIFDLFWWSILAEMLDYTKNPVLVFGIGLSANVFGVLWGDALGIAVTSINLPGAEVAVIALTVVCVTLVMLPPLNRQLVILLKNHAYLAAYDRLSVDRQAQVILQ
ncbi:MAG: LuxR family transcriptional regulator, partial [Firmicutes bacterium]|nr:LuxR family transcriptional regulator [Bacillota bacterium]